MATLPVSPSNNFIPNNLIIGLEFPLCFAMQFCYSIISCRFIESDNLCTHEISLPETSAPPEMARQIMGAFDDTKMAITFFLNNAIWKSFGLVRISSSRWNYEINTFKKFNFGCVCPISYASYYELLLKIEAYIWYESYVQNID